MTKLIAIILALACACGLVVGGLMFSARSPLDLLGVKIGEPELSEGWTQDDGETAEEDYWIDEGFNGTFWQGDDMLLAAVWEEGFTYRLTVTADGAEQSFLCNYKDVEIDEEAYVSLSGDAEFLYSYRTGELLWKREGAQDAVFTRIIDPLDNSRWYTDGKTITIHWLGGNDYDVYIEKQFTSWDYRCVLDEEADALKGAGVKTDYSNEIYADSQAEFAFRDARRGLVWTDEKEESALSGLAFEAVANDLAVSMWTNDEYFVFVTWSDGYYDVQVSRDGEVYLYLCQYDWDAAVLTSVDVSTVDTDSFSMYIEKDNYTRSGSFTLLEDDTMIWKDDGITGEEGIVIPRF